MIVFKRFFDPARLEQAYVIVTRQCNLSCVHCVRGHGREEAHTMRVVDFCRVLEQIVRVQPRLRLIMSGGEPTIHPNVVELTQRARQIIELVTLVTNGTKLSVLQRVVSAVPDIRIQVSVDGNERAHDNIRGPGTYQQAMETVRALAWNGVDVCVSTTLNRQNVHSIDELFFDLSATGINSWKVSPEIAAGAAQYRIDDHLPWDKWNQVVKHIQELSTSWSGKVIAKTMFSFIGRAVPWNELPPELLDRAGCGAGTKRFYVYPDLSIIGCPYLVKYKLGNLREQPLSEILQGINSSGLSTLKFDVSTPCGSCEYFRICRGGCLGRSLSHHGQLNWGDPRCPLVFASLT